MRLNTLKPAEGAKKDAHRVGRGVGSGWGKTAGRGHKGQKSRAGGFHKVGFEGGQMPLHRRLPKRGFTSLTHKFVEMIRLSDLEALPVDVVTIDAVRQAGLIGALTEQVRVIAAGKLTKKVTVQGLKVTKGAKAAIVTTEVCNAAARHRAAQLGIAVIDLEELKTGLLVHRLKVIMKAE